MKATDPRTLSTKDYTERVVVFVKKFEVLDQAPRELHMMYKPVTGEIYKAIGESIDCTDNEIVEKVLYELAGTENKYVWSRDKEEFLDKFTRY